MAEINHRYLKDNEGETYFPVTHVDAVQGIDVGEINSEFDLKIAEQSARIDNNTISITNLNDMLENLIKDTGWVDIEIPEENKNNSLSGGFDSGVRKIDINNSISIRSIRLNVSKINGSSMVIAKIPTGFVDKNQSFPARGHGYRHPVTIEIKNDTVTAFVHPDDEALVNWVYQEFTWLG